MLTEEAIKAYELSKLGRADVSLLSLHDEAPESVKKFSLRSMTGEFTRAIGFLFKPKMNSDHSKATARVKRRPPLFSDVQLGSITEIDEELNKEKH